MKKKVAVVDDTMRQNIATLITHDMRLEAFRAGVPLPLTQHYILSRDPQKRQLQRAVARKHVYEGPRLEAAVRRAARWIRSRGAQCGDAPHHIRLAMAAFKAAQPKRFDAMMASLVDA